MQIGSLVRHKQQGVIGIVTAVYETRIVFLAYGKPWRTYMHAVEVICE